MKLAAGTHLGPYRIVEAAGRGGMATVYKAYHASLERFVAVKVLPDFVSDDDTAFLTRFRREAVAVARLRHPNILTVFDHGEEEGVAYMVTEFVDGGTLESRLGQPMPLDDVVKLIGPIAQALDYAHSRDILHRDVKPSNVLLTEDWTPVLSDFGLAHLMGGSQARLTRADSVLGTPEYMSPEQCAGKPLTAAADQYSLAVVVYEMLTGQLPFTAETPQALILAHIGEPVPAPRERNPELPAAAEQALVKALAKNPQHRFASCAEFVDALASGVPGVVPVRTATTRLRPGPTGSVKPARRRRWPLAAGVALVIVALLAAGGFLAVNGGLLAASMQGQSPPPDQPLASPSPSTLHTPHRGKILYQMRASSDLTDMTDSRTGRYEYKDGVLQLTVTVPPGNVGVGLVVPRQKSYVLETLIAPDPGSDSTVSLVVRQPAATEKNQIYLECDIRNRTLAFYTWQQDTGTVQVSQPFTFDKPGKNRGGGLSIQLGVVVNDTHYAVYVNDATDPAIEADVPDVHGFTAPEIEAHASVPGTVKIQGAWVYLYDKG
jgi:serine/threonine-protein kinase